MARNPLSAAIHTMVTICEMSAYAPSGAQKPWLAQVVPPSKTSTTATTPAEKNRFEMIPARWSPNAPDMTNIAAGNEPITVRTHPRSENPDVTAREAEPAIENASAARTAIRMNNTAAAAVLPRCNPPLRAFSRTPDNGGMPDGEGRARVSGHPHAGPKTGDKPDRQPEAWPGAGITANAMLPWLGTAGLPVQWSRGVGRGVYGAGEVHPSGRRRQPRLFLAS